MPHDIPPPPDYEALEQQQWLENAKEVVDRLDKNDINLMNRIKTYVWRSEYDLEQTKNKIREDPMFAAHFAKEPRRTGMHEAIAGEWLRGLPMITNFRTLPKSGKDAIHIDSDGGLRENMPHAPSKSLDFQWRTGKFTIYASHKYTKEGGGNQDSQFREMRELLRKFQVGGVNSNFIALLVIVDGPYYTTARMNDLLKFARTQPPLSSAMPIQGVPAWLQELTGH